MRISLSSALILGLIITCPIKSFADAVSSAEKLAASTLTRLERTQKGHIETYLNKPCLKLSGRLSAAAREVCVAIGGLTDVTALGGDAPIACRDAKSACGYSNGKSKSSTNRIASLGRSLPNVLKPFNSRLLSASRTVERLNLQKGRLNERLPALDASCALDAVRYKYKCNSAIAIRARIVKIEELITLHSVTVVHILNQGIEHSNAAIAALIGEPEGIALRIDHALSNQKEFICGRAEVACAPTPKPSPSPTPGTGDVPLPTPTPNDVPLCQIGGIC